jgi:hypothetical protein
MKLAWLCYYYDTENEPDGLVKIVFEEPITYHYRKVVPIVYAEIVE